MKTLLRAPYLLSPGWLRIDPNFALLRGHLLFERRTAGAEPVSPLLTR